MSDILDSTWGGRVGVATDQLLNTLLFDGSEDMTVSRHAALAAQAGQEWGCITCKVLSALVQKNHCALTLDPNVQETTGAAIKAAAIMALGFALFGWAVHWLVSLI